MRWMLFLGLHPVKEEAPLRAQQVQLVLTALQGRSQESGTASERSIPCAYIFDCLSSHPTRGAVSSK